MYTKIRNSYILNTHVAHTLAMYQIKKSKQKMRSKIERSNARRQINLNVIYYVYSRTEGKRIWFSAGCYIYIVMYTRGEIKKLKKGL
jgi:hypothetical protein